MHILFQYTLASSRLLLPGKRSLYHTIVVPLDGGEMGTTTGFQLIFLFWISSVTGGGDNQAPLFDVDMYGTRPGKISAEGADGLSSKDVYNIEVEEKSGSGNVSITTFQLLSDFPVTRYSMTCGFFL